MPKCARLLLTLGALAAIAPVITACNTTRGAGEDLSAAGQSIEHSADKNNTYGH